MSKNQQDAKTVLPKFQRWKKIETDEEWAESSDERSAKREENRRSQEENKFVIRLVNNIVVNEKYREMILECHQKVSTIDGMKMLKDPSENHVNRIVAQESSSLSFISFLKHLVEINIELRGKKIVLKRVRERRAERRVARDARREKEIERYKLLIERNCKPNERYYQELSRDKNFWESIKRHQIWEEERVKQKEEEEYSESEKKFEIELLKLIEADEQYARLILEHPDVVKISLDVDIIQSTPESCTTSSQRIESSEITSSQKSYPSYFSTLQETLNEVIEAIGQAFKKYKYEQQ